MCGDLLWDLLEGELFVVWLFFLPILLVLFLLVPVVFGDEGKERIPELLLVVPGVFQQFIQLHQIRYPEVQTLQEHQGGKKDGCQAYHRTKCTNYLPTRRLEPLVVYPVKVGVTTGWKHDLYQEQGFWLGLPDYFLN